MTTETKVEAVALEYVPGRLDETAPARIWLQVDVMADNDDRGDEFPGPDHVTWQDESLGGLEVQYFRADLHQSAITALEGEVERLRGERSALIARIQSAVTNVAVPKMTESRAEYFKTGARATIAAVNHALTKESP